MSARTNTAASVFLFGIGVALCASGGEADTALRPHAASLHWDFNGSLEGACELEFRGKAAAKFVATAEVPGTVNGAVALGLGRDKEQHLVTPAGVDAALTPPFSIEAWIQPTQLDQWNRIALRWGNAPRYAYHLALHDGRISLCVGQPDGKLVFAEGGRVEPGRWYHIAGIARRDETTPDQSLLEVYLNGRRVGSARYNGSVLPADNEPLGIGDSATTPSPSCTFRGYVDELSLWKRALMPDELRQHFAARQPILESLETPRRKAEIARRARAVERLKRFGVERVVFAERGMGQDMAGHYYANFGYYCTDPDRWFHARDGGSLCVLDVRNVEAVGRSTDDACSKSDDVTMLVDDPGGSVRDPQVDFDGQRIMFSYRKGGAHHYNLYEIGANGRGLRQITDGPWDDVEPAYLPDGGIVFSSSRCKRYIGCWLAPSATLHRCDRDGRNIRLLSSGNFTENTPAVLPDGRVLYTRWEYVNRDPVSFHHLWTMNPDGSGPMVFFGNMHLGSVFIDAKPIPASDRIVLIDSPGHGINEHTGFVATATAKFGPDARSSVCHISREPRFRDPYPLSDDTFLVARGNELLVMDSAGTTELLYAAPSEIHEPMPLLPRPRPPALPSKVDLTRSTGTVILADVYTGRNMAGVRRGEVKKLLVVEDLPKPANFHGGGSQPIGHGVTSTLKRILGAVPVEADGSAHFEVPAMRSVYFALLDERDRSIKQMRSFVTVQPGETVGCVGCHDSRRQSPATNRTTIAMLRGPSRIDPIAEVPGVLDFPRDVQPILDRHCVRCHNPDRRDGGVALAGDRGPVYSLSYYALFLHWQIKDTGGPPADMSGRQPGNDRPYETYSSASPLMKMIDGSHYGVRLADREVRTVRSWIDSSAQFAGTYAAIGTGQVGGCWNLNEPVRVMADAWPSTPPCKDVIQRRCVSCHGRMLPQHVTDQIPVSFGDMLSWERPLTRYSRHNLYNLSRPEKSLILLAPLARSAGGYADSPLASAAIKPVIDDRRHPPKPTGHPVIFESTEDTDFQNVLAHIDSARIKLEEIKRFDMPGFKPNEHYVREMKRYGVLSPTLDLARDPIDVYATDEAYWRSFWPR